MEQPTWFNIEDEEDDIDEQFAANLSKDVLVFCIDASSAMHVVPPTPEGSKRSKRVKPLKSLFYQSLKCALDVMKRKVVTSPNDYLGILFFNTAEKSGTIVSRNHWLYQPICQPGASQITALMDLLDAADADPDHLIKTYAPNDGDTVPIGDVFASCNYVFRSGHPKAATKRVFYITNEDSPKSLTGPAGKRLEDLTQQTIVVVPFFISTPEKPFDPSKFYTPVFASGRNNIEEDRLPFGDVCQGFDAVISEMEGRVSPKRCVWSIPMEVADGFSISVKGYGLIAEFRKPPYRYVSSRGQITEEVVSKTVYFDKDQQTQVDGTKILYGMAIDFGTDALLQYGESKHDKRAREKEQEHQPKKVLFTAEQVRLLRTLDLEPGIKILGFKDRSDLQFEDNIKHAYFIYPDESILGSTRTFAALLKSCLKLNKIAIARVTMRKNSSPEFCALHPQAERYDDKGTQLVPPGFNLIPLPSADEIREPPLSEAKRSSEELVEAARTIIKKMIMPKGYVPKDYPNPSLALHFAFLEANALGTEFDPDLIRDKTLPKYESIHSRAGDAIRTWGELLEQEDAAHFVATSSKKRPTTTSDGFDEAEILAHVEDGTSHKLTVSVLRDYLKYKAQKIPSGAKKANLLDLLSDYLDAQK